MRKYSKDPKAKLRKKADDLLQDYIRAKYDEQYCLNCGIKPVEVGHHFVAKKNSNALRYYLPNIIPLCLGCHSLVTHQPSAVNPKICFTLGEEWYKDLEETRKQDVKYNIGWIQMQYRILQELMAELNKNA